MKSDKKLEKALLGETIHRNSKSSQNLYKSQNSQLLQRVQLLESELKHLRGDQPTTFKNTLDQLQTEKSSLSDKIKLLEKSLSEVKRERQELSRSLHLNSERVTLLEGDKAALTQNIKQLQKQLQEFQSTNSSLVDQRASLKASLAKLDCEKESISAKLEQAEKDYQAMLATSDQEKTNMTWVFQRQSKVLASKCIGLELTRVLTRRVKEVLSKFQAEAHFKALKLGHLKTLQHLRNKYWENRLHTDFFRWKKVREWKNSEKVISSLVVNSKEKALLKAFLSTWKKEFQLRVSLKNNFLKATKTINSVFESNQNSLKTRKIAKWKELLRVKQLRSKYLKKLLNRKQKTLQSKSFTKWKDFKTHLDSTQSKEDLASMYSSLLVKQSVFCALKSITQVSNLKKELLGLAESASQQKQKLKILTDFKLASHKTKLKHSRLRLLLKSLTTNYKSLAFSCWTSKIQTHKNFYKLKRVSKVVTSQKSTAFLKLTFCNWKLYSQTAKFRKSTLSMETENTLRIQNLTQETNFQIQHQSKLSALKTLNYICKASLKRYFKHWNSYKTKYFSAVSRIKLIFAQTHHKQLSFYFSKWKQTYLELFIYDLKYQSHQLSNQKQKVTSHLSHFENLFHVQSGEIQDLKKKFLKRILAKLSTRVILDKLRLWCRVSLAKANRKVALTKLTDCLNQIKTKMAYLKVVNFSKVNQCKLTKANKLDLLKHKCSLKLLKKVFDFFKNQHQNANKVAKFNNRTLLKLKKKSFFLWLEAKSLEQHRKLKVYRLLVNNSKTNLLVAVNFWKEHILLSSLIKLMKSNEENQTTTTELEEQVYSLERDLEVQLTQTEFFKCSVVYRTFKGVLSKTLQSYIRKWCNNASLATSILEASRFLAFMIHTSRKRRAMLAIFKVSQSKAVTQKNSKKLQSAKSHLGFRTKISTLKAWKYFVNQTKTLKKANSAKARALVNRRVRAALYRAFSYWVSRVKQKKLNRLLYKEKSKQIRQKTLTSKTLAVFSSWKNSAVHRTAKKTALSKVSAKFYSKELKKFFSNWKLFSVSLKCECVNQSLKLSLEKTQKQLNTSSNSLRDQVLLTQRFKENLHKMTKAHSVSLFNFTANKLLKNYLNTWKTCLNKAKLAEIEAELLSFKERYFYLQEKCLDLESQNYKLSEENQELQAASEEALALAESIETLNYESEHLYHTLALNSLQK